MKKGEPENWTKFAQTYVIKHSYGDWSDITTGLIVEQVPMCFLKVLVAHGRKWSEAQQLSWLLSQPTFAEYNQPSETHPNFLFSD